jgi:dTDP-4-amino-4,6-dideoxygalactose transaminase
MPENTSCSEQYYCIRVDEDLFGESRDVVYQRLKEHGFMARKYFSPLVSDYPCYNAMPSANSKFLPVATSVASQVLCLPFYSGVTTAQSEEIVRLIISDV